jgi:pimeloyl-ACP methyl ester carboxylesterase
MSRASDALQATRRACARAAWVAGGIALDAAYATARQAAAFRARGGGQRVATGPEGSPTVRTTSEPPRGGRPPAVVLIPGIYEPAAFLDPLRARLEERGHEVAVVEELGWNLRTVPDSAALVAERLRELGLAGVLIVAHSKGGLIGKELLVTEPSLARGMVSISTPYGGHPFSRIAPTPALRAFRATDPVMLALAAERAANASIVSISAEIDPIVIGGTWLEGARNICLPVVGHFRILSHPAFLTLLDELLDEAGAGGKSPPPSGTKRQGRNVE